MRHQGDAGLLRKNQALKDLPQPQLSFAFGLVILKPPPVSASLKSTTVPRRYCALMASTRTVTPSCTDAESPARCSSKPCHIAFPNSRLARHKPGNSSRCFPACSIYPSPRPPRAASASEMVSVVNALIIGKISAIEWQVKRRQFLSAACFFSSAAFVCGNNSSSRTIKLSNCFASPPPTVPIKGNACNPAFFVQKASVLE